MSGSTWRNIHHMSRTPRDAHGTRRSRGTWKRQDVLRTKTEYNVRKSTISSLLTVTALVPLPSLNPTSDLDSTYPWALGGLGAQLVPGATGWWSR